MYFMRIIAMLVLATLNLPPAIPPETKGLVAGYYMTPHGCITNRGYRPMVTTTTLLQLEAARLSPDDPQAKIAYDYAQFPSAYDSYSARYYASRGQFDQALRHYRVAIEKEAKENVTQGSRDFTRLAYSILLYRLHHVAEAKAQWRTLIEGGKKWTKIPDSATAAALVGHFHEALVQYAMSPPSFNPVTFGDSGAAYNLQRGLNAAAVNDIPRASTYLGYALECAPFFQVPHLALGAIAALKNDFTTSRHEWVATLEGWDVASPTSAGITVAQYDAMYLLLKFD
jgi:tetratricopeptide (TPR) repeat protein